MNLKKGYTSRYIVKNKKQEKNKAVPGPLRKVHRVPGSVPSPIPSSPGAKNEVKLRSQKSKKKNVRTQKILLPAQREFNFDLKMVTKWAKID